MRRKQRQTEAWKSRGKEFLLSVNLSDRGRFSGPARTWNVSLVSLDLGCAFPRPLV